MADNRKSRAKKNILVSLASQIVVLLCGIVVPRALIGAFGSEAYGATASITQFLSYITLLEGGIGGVARAALYEPLSQNNYDTISAIMSEIKRFFNVIAWIFVGYVLLLACGFQTISNVECMDWISTFILVIIISISTFGQYFIGISYAIFLQADQKSYISNGVSTIATIINAVCTIFLIYCGCGMLIVKLVSSCIYFMRPVILWAYVKRRYPLSTNSMRPNKTYLKQKWSGLGQHIAFFLHSNTDIVVLTVLTDLRVVAVYSVYNMIVSHMQNLAVAFTSGMEAVFGDMLARKENDELNQSFQSYEMIISVIAVTLFATTAVLIVPFITLYTSNITDTNYIVPAFALLLVLSALCFCIRTPYHAMIIAAGHFKQTSLAAYGEAIMNVVISVLLVSKYGLIGVAIGTLAATAFRFVYYVVYLSKNIIERKPKLFLNRLIINTVAFVASCFTGGKVLSIVSIANYLHWCVCGIFMILVVGFITVSVNFVFDRKSSCRLLHILTKK